VQTISIVPVGATTTAEERIDRGAHAEEVGICTPSFARDVIKRVGVYQQRFRREHDRTLVYLADEYYISAGIAPPPSAHYDGFAQYENGIGMTRAFLEDWRRTKRRRRLADRPILGARGLARERREPATDLSNIAVARDIRSVAFVCGTLFASTLRTVAAEFASQTGIRAHVIEVQNRFFGPRVNVSGLLTGRDVERAVMGRDLGDLVVLPRYALDYTGSRFLDDLTPAELQDSLNVPIAFASTMREVLQIVSEPLESGVSGATVGAATNGKSWVDFPST
jgi:NifB/MoaA-like Fe-S oxidoreductase